VLTENQVVIAMCAWLQSNGYTISSHKLDTQSGHDIEAVKDGRTIYVECKGGSSKKTGQPFGIDYQWRAASGALFNQVRLKEKHKDSEVGIALPNGGRYPELMADLKGFCISNRIRIFWLSESAQVSEW
jgi:hypothetical protein